MVCENTIKFLKFSYILPKKVEVESQPKNHYLNIYAMITIFFSYVPIGVTLHMIYNIKREFHLTVFIFLKNSLGLLINYYIIS